MPRAKRGFKARRRRNRVLNHAEGFFGSRHKLFAFAMEVVRKSWVYGYIGRRLRRRDFRRLWITRINAGARESGLSYSRLINGLELAAIEIDRKVLADLAVFDKPAFAELANRAKAALGIA